MLPIYMPLDLAAGIGWGMALDWLRRRVLPVSQQWAAIGMAGLVVLGQAGLALPTFPYYLTYYNPLLMRTRDVTNDMLIGWGEGLDAAARYLAQQPDVRQTTTAAWYGFGPLAGFIRAFRFRFRTIFRLIIWSFIKMKCSASCRRASFCSTICAGRRNRR
ncbi:MAG: hypothetical protein R2911_27840 [Caldilineaceae bacterium]